jgi:hypothetical protein
VDNLREGRGILTDKVKGLVIEGFFKAHKLHGDVTIKRLSDSSTRFQGQMVLGKKHGNCSIEDDYEQYEGPFLNDKKEGLGVHFDKISLIRYEGIFEGDKKKVFANDMRVSFYNYVEPSPPPGLTAA